MIVDTARNVIVGMTLVGPSTGELLHAATIAIVGAVPLDRLWHAVPAYPTIMAAELIIMGIGNYWMSQMNLNISSWEVMLRNEGGSVGTSVAQTIQERREIFHALRLNENLDRLNPAVKSFMGQAQPGFLQQTGDPAAAKQMTLQALENLREQQSSALAYFDTFFVFAAVGVALSFLVLLMKPSVAAKGAYGFTR
jgi:MFS transporter, DHA2 family, multidrug resistance protein